jgi:threonine/homoserine/homoserine lactone efflux protein
MDDRRWTIVGHNLLAMFGTQHLTLFIVSGILLNLTPGQDTFYIVGRSVSQGRRAGILSVLGIVPGVPFTLLPLHSVCSALLATSAPAFTVVKTPRVPCTSAISASG